MEVDESSISDKGVIVIITDYREGKYCWDENYNIEKKENNNWQVVEPIKPVIVNALAHYVDENKQFRQAINWENYYGKLSKGVYRITKRLYENDQSIQLYTDEFEIS